MAMMMVMKMVVKTEKMKIRSIQLLKQSKGNTQKYKMQRHEGRKESEKTEKCNYKERLQEIFSVL